VLHTLRTDSPAGMTPGGTWVVREKLVDYALPAPLKKLIVES
jgi:A/G-specific adenine glycosylase